MHGRLLIIFSVYPFLPKRFHIPVSLLLHSLKQYGRNILAVLIRFRGRRRMDSQQRYFLFVQGTVGAACVRHQRHASAQFAKRAVRCRKNHIIPDPPTITIFFVFKKSLVKKKLKKGENKKVIPENSKRAMVNNIQKVNYFKKV